MKIEEALDKFIVQLEADGRSRNTILQYTRHIRLFARWAAQVGHSGVISEFTHEVYSQVFIVPTGANTARRWSHEGLIGECDPILSEGLFHVPASGRLHYQESWAYDPARNLRFSAP